jgi:hypothetical protein
MTYAAISFVLGAVLGSRWRAIVLIPVSALILPVAVFSGLSSGEAYVWVAVMGFACVASLQFGYLFAATIRVALFHAPARSAEDKQSGLARTPGLRTDP